ncbi:3-hydroxyisobutyrate dehydrogenase, mitochondrial [Onthophagus taurus]|uniref:3-hydroxyisobutyrate dehydrogenase, mitochondrial n=1 Tax=Onthophagus taurus TaxID=166361 RepID=UPI000C2081D6|nr:3-hydroxyisobutyrate dehydrogenase, mitochondrial [Onthophagus taurus]
MFRRTILLFNLRSNLLHQRNQSTDVGFIGIGNMGARMATNMIQKGLKLKVFDVVPNAAKSVAGATVCSSPKEAAQGCKVVITMLPDGGIVKETLEGKNGIMEGIDKNGLYVDCSTIDSSVAQDLYKTAKSNGFRFLDAPVSGGVTGAQAATLTFMVGGDKADLDFVEPILLKAGARVVHCGEPGAGQIAKVCNNLLLAASMTAVSEAMNLGIKMGLDAKVLTSIINSSTGRCWSSETYNPVPGLMPNVPSSNGYKGGFMMKLTAKDLALAQNTALRCGAPLPITAVVHQIYRVMMTQGYGDKDFSSTYEFFKGAK